MGMRIDFDKPLTDEERAYLEACNRHREITENDVRFEGADEPVSQPTPMQRELMQQLGTGSQETSSREDDEGTDDDTPYGEWTNEELREELKNRELPTEGKKVDLVKRLEEDDAVTAQ